MDRPLKNFMNVSVNGCVFPMCLVHPQGDPPFSWGWRRWDWKGKGWRSSPALSSAQAGGTGQEVIARVRRGKLVLSRARQQRGATKVRWSRVPDVDIFLSLFYEL